MKLGKNAKNRRKKKKEKAEILAQENQQKRGTLTPLIQQTNWANQIFLCQNDYEEKMLPAFQHST